MAIRCMYLLLVLLWPHACRLLVAFTLQEFEHLGLEPENSCWILC